MTPSRSLIAPLLWTLSAPLGFCQSDPALENVKPTPQVCVITVGAPAGNIAEWKSDSVFSFKATDEGAAPPMDLYYQKNEKGKRTYELFPFGLGQSTQPIAAPQSSVVLYKRAVTPAGESSYTPDFELPVKGTSLTALVLWRDKKNPDWKKPNILSIDASPEAWPEGEVRFLNLTPVEIGLTLLDGRFPIKPSASHASRVSAGKPFPYKIEATVNGEAVFVCSTAVSMVSPTRTLVVAFGNQKGAAESMSIDIPMPTTPTPAAPIAPTAAKADPGI